jgi:hypothetical protein
MRFFLCLVCLACAAALSADEIILNEEFWADLQPIIPQGEQSVSADTALKRILEEGRYVFSGMIFGFSFSYTPLDRGRNIQEEFTLEPVFQIPWGDPNLFVHATRREGARVYARLRYRLHEFQENWYEGTLSNTISSSAGAGDAPLFAGYQEKISAIRNSVKNAVREYARGRIDNKPLKVTGTVFLDGAPRIEISSGAFHAVSFVRLKIDEVVTYGAY